jgi:hypothetical protein
MRPLRTTALIPLVLGIAGCALPPAVTIVSFVADGISMASSGKTVTDQAISFLAHKDCRLWRLAQGKSICGSEASVVAVAALPPALPLHAASPALRPPDASVYAAPPPAEAAPAAEPTPMAFVLTPAVAPAAPKPAATGSNSAPAVGAPTGGISRQNFAAAPAASPHQAAPANVAPAAAPSAQPAMLHATGEARVRGEMIIRSGTDEAEARALADSLHAAGATVRPARHGDVTIYEVVMGLSG